MFAVPFSIQLFVVLLLILFVVLPIASLVVRLVFPQRKVPKTRISATWSLRRVVIAVGGMLLTLLVLLLTAGGAFIGLALGNLITFSPYIRMNPDELHTILIFVGAGVGFIVATLFLALFFTFAEIERNTRHTAAMFERLVTQMQQT